MKKVERNAKTSEKSRARALANERGAATVLMAGVMLALLGLTVILTGYASFHTARAQLATLADNAALAGANAGLTSAVSPCQAANSLVENAKAQLIACKEKPTQRGAFRGSDTVVKLSRVVKVMGMSFTLEAKAKAGPIF